MAENDSAVPPTPQAPPPLPDVLDMAEQAWCFSAAVIVLVVASLAAGGETASGTELFQDIGWINSGGTVLKLFYSLLILSLIAAIVERLLETCVSAFRRPVREGLEIQRDHWKRVYMKDSKNVAMQQGLLAAEVTLQTFRARTRFRTLACGAILGACVGAVIDLPLLDLLTGSKSSFIQFAEVIVISLLVAGGAEPLHHLISSFQKSVRNFAATKSKLR